MLQIYEKIAEKIAHKRVFLTFLSLILIQTFALAQNDSKITIQQKNITVIDALKTVEKQSKKSINYSYLESGMKSPSLLRWYQVRFRGMRSASLTGLLLFLLIRNHYNLYPSSG